MMQAILIPLKISPADQWEGQAGWTVRATVCMQACPLSSCWTPFLVGQIHEVAGVAESGSSTTPLR